MYKKTFPYLISLLLILSSCKSSHNKLIVKGKLNTPKETYLYFQELTAKNDGITDSLLLTSSGRFKFERELSSPSFFRIWTSLSAKQITLAAHPGERIKISGEANNLLHTYSIQGSEDSELTKDLIRKLDHTIIKADSLNKMYIQYKNNPNIENIRKVLSLNYNSLIDSQRLYNISFIESHPSSIVSILALYQQISQDTWILYKDEDLKYFEKVDSAVYRKFPNAPYVNMLHGNVQEMKSQQQKLQMQQMLSAMGSKAPNIVLPGINGDSIRLSSLKGKCVLVYFWASWNSTSRTENTELKRIYRKYMQKGFEIFQVSLDKSKESWISAVRADGIWWKQGCDLKFWDSPAAIAYNIKSIPTSFLIDKEEIIVGRDMRGEPLETKIEEILDIKSNTIER